ncbi:STAS domain-containing protein [Angustibacter sp. Root456]|uniref:STAS domain-containing protein n=1 Tax=Angustibacter sp. Root456 TaxID=1736539 RepID=UPI0006FBE666|nr:STAS domain-containing protein [Angustibacter sp. Root456]KQX64396.1 hypothetical protein ASD06_09435 [Angustibacter sp. Root456]
MSRPFDDPMVRDGLLLESATGASGAVLVRAAGRLTLDTRARLRWLLRAVTPARGGDVHLDLRQVTEADAAGVSILLVQARSCRATGGRLRVVATSRAVHDVLVKVGASDLALAAERSTEAS